MPVMRFIVSAAFAWMLVRATFANTVAWRHPQTLRSASVDRATKAAVAAERIVGQHRTRT